MVRNVLLIYKDYLKRVENYYKSKGINIGLNLTDTLNCLNIEYELLGVASTILSEYNYFNSILCKVGSKYKIKSYYSSDEVVFEDLMYLEKISKKSWIYSDFQGYESIQVPNSSIKNEDILEDTQIEGISEKIGDLKESDTKEEKEETPHGYNYNMNDVMKMYQNASMTDISMTDDEEIEAEYDNYVEDMYSDNNDEEDYDENNEDEEDYDEYAENVYDTEEDDNELEEDYDNTDDELDNYAENIYGTEESDEVSLDEDEYIEGMEEDTNEEDEDESVEDDTDDEDYVDYVEDMEDTEDDDEYIEGMEDTEDEYMEDEYMEDDYSDDEYVEGMEDDTEDEEYIEGMEDDYSDEESIEGYSDDEDEYIEGMEEYSGEDTEGVDSDDEEDDYIESLYSTDEDEETEDEEDLDDFEGAEDEDFEGLDDDIDSNFDLGNYEEEVSNPAERGSNITAKDTVPFEVTLANNIENIANMAIRGASKLVRSFQNMDKEK